MTVQFTPRRSGKRARFPNRIREYRLRAGLSQEALGQRLGTGRKMVSAWERGSQLPTVANLFRLARALGTLSEALYQDLYAAARKSSDDKTDR